jgi:hypothetical protein
VVIHFSLLEVIGKTLEQNAYSRHRSDIPLKSHSPGLRAAMENAAIRCSEIEDDGVVGQFFGAPAFPNTEARQMRARQTKGLGKRAIATDQQVLVAGLYRCD